MVAFNEGHHAEALAEFRRCLDAAKGRTDPVHSLALFYAAEAAFQLGSAAFAAGDHDAALRHFEAARRWNPRFPDLQFQFAVLAVVLGQHEEALDGIDSALLLDPDHVGARALQALLLRQGGDAAADDMSWLAEHGSRHPVAEAILGFFRQRDAQVAALLRAEPAVETPAPAGAVAPAHGDP